MHVKYLQCVRCGNKVSKDKIQFRCEKCGGGLDVIYDYDEIKDKVSWKELRKRPFNHYRYREFFPTLNDKNLIKLGAGGTPLIFSENLLKDSKIKLYFKLESSNPTGSFKDRGTSIELSKALDFNSKEIVVASTGNMGASIAAYCAKAQIKANIFIPEKTPGIKRKQMKSHGAKIIQVHGDYVLAAQKAMEMFNKKGIYLLGDYPYRGEGEKSVGHEIMDELNADYIVVPIGNGTLLKGIWKGVKELKLTGLIEKTPKMIGVQSENCDTVIGSFLNNSAPSYVNDPVTVATAIACGSPLDGQEALESLQESNGLGITVSDREILEAKRLLAQQEGIYAEESGAVSLAGLIKLSKKKQTREQLREKTIVCIITGHGLKT